MSTLRSPAGPPSCRRTFAAQADSLPVRDALGDLDLDALAVDGEVHRRAEDGVAEVDGQLGLDVGAALRPARTARRRRRDRRRCR